MSCEHAWINHAASKELAAATERNSIIAIILMDDVDDEGGISSNPFTTSPPLLPEMVMDFPWMRFV